MSTVMLPLNFALKMYINLLNLNQSILSTEIFFLNTYYIVSCSLIAAYLSQ